jgi:hypothetical protein
MLTTSEEKIHKVKDKTRRAVGLLMENILANGVVSKIELIFFSKI